MSSSLVKLMEGAIDAYETKEIDGDQLCEVMQEVVEKLRAFQERIRFEEGGADADRSADDAETPADPPAPPEAPGTQDR